MNDTYYVLQSAAEFQLKEKGSRFLAYAFPVESEDEAKHKLTELRKKYYDATHHCYAYTVGYPKATTRQSDDGEPSGTAGLPIQNQIRAKGVQNTLVVVVRYYGGTKLGAAGLVQAYKTAAAGVLNEAVLKELYLTAKVTVKVPFANLNEVMTIAKKQKQQPLFEENTANPEIQHLSFRIKLSELAAFEAALQPLHYVDFAVETV
jgi:uncharacterized YigZ family protein